MRSRLGRRSLTDDESTKTVIYNVENRATLSPQWIKRYQNILIHRPKLELQFVTFFMSTLYKIKPNKQPWIATPTKYIEDHKYQDWLYDPLMYQKS